jgi:hypothetical protein
MENSLIEIRRENLPKEGSPWMIFSYNVILGIPKIKVILTNKGCSFRKYWCI